MSNSNISNEQLIWKVLDGDIRPEELEMFEKRLTTDLQLREEFEGAKELQQLLSQQSAVMQPSMRFEKNVMEQIAQTTMVHSAKVVISKKIVWSIGALFIIMLALLTVYLLKNLDLQFEPSTVGDSLFDVDWKKFPTTTFTMLFALLGGICFPLLVDHYLRSKKSKMRAA